jgi:hypothetical protein
MWSVLAAVFAAFAIGGLLYAYNSEEIRVAATGSPPHLGDQRMLPPAKPQ